ncbi:phosphodiester glycosidase family protein [Rhabdochromatium marinum]|uniref:phosphodiester glycosidase family protein n=1 Tax=Rhabdochromatium marinum TaxID=48729 RepID=UPI001905A034|nr:phosphodiester glycosidase family protein [Rhabdochromatium marinum]MBK1649983.1 hypothetical protein [Rhabdochromatium marinum]
MPSHPPGLRLAALLCAALIASAPAAVQAQTQTQTQTQAATGELDWQPEATEPRHTPAADLYYSQAAARRRSDQQSVEAHLAFFHSRAFRLAVVDLPPERPEEDARIDVALRAAGLPAGVNGGFFHADRRPVGLVIANGRWINHLERAKLLSGVLYSDAQGNYLLRRAAFRDHAGIRALLQTGPYLVERGRQVRGLSNTATARRTFAATDWRGHWVLGMTRNPVTLADLADCLATPGSLTHWPIERAINLDGGSSSGFFFDRTPEQAAVVQHPWKPVRNLLGIAPR